MSGFSGMHEAVELERKWRWPSCSGHLSPNKLTAYMSHHFIFQHTNCIHNVIQTSQWPTAFNNNQYMRQHYWPRALKTCQIITTQYRHNRVTEITKTQTFTIAWVVCHINISHIIYLLVDYSALWQKLSIFLNHVPLVLCYTFQRGYQYDS